MTDLYELLNRAIDSQPDTPEARLAVYNHIRGLYARRREEIDPALPESAIQEEQARLLRDQAALETVIARIEAERTGAPPPGEEVLSFDRFAPDQDQPSAPETGDETTPAAAAPAADQGRGRPRVAARRQPKEGGSSRRGLAIAAVALVLAGIGGVAWWLRASGPAPIADETPAVAAQQAADDNDKIVERVSGEPPPDEPPAQPDASVAVVPNGQPAQQAAPGAGTSEQSELVAQRAFLFELDDQNAEQPLISPGHVVWRLEGKGTAAAVLYMDVSLPDAGVSFSLVIRPNDDASLPASHTIEATFTNAADRPERVVRDMAIPQMRIDKEPRGVPLTGLTIPVADNVFLVGLSNLASDVERNYNLLRERDWVDLAVRFADGRVGTITFAKGSVGRQLISDAVDSWR